MKQKFFRTPFAASGDKQAVPEFMDQEGYVNYPEGFTEDYEKDLATDAHAKAPERAVFNELLFNITNNLKQYQENGFPEFITAADNDGVPYAYAKSAIVNFNNKLYVSLVSNNNSTPGSVKWQPFLYQRATEEQALEGKDNETLITPETLLAGLGNFQSILKPYLLPIGSIIAWGSATPPAGWLELNGQAFDRALYPELTKVYPSGILPDLRGEFIRGWDHGRGLDGGRGLLSVQGDTIRNITGTVGPVAASQDGQYNPTSSGAFNHVTQTVNSDGGERRLGFQIQFDASRSVPTSNENRPRNISLMYIIKTDLAEDEKGDVPTNLIIAPGNINDAVGKEFPLSSTVLPANLASSFPVSYQSSDVSICTVSAAGVVKLIGSGSATVIASISTGLSATIKVKSSVVLTKLAIVSVPAMTAGDSLQLPITPTPSNYTEEIQFSSSNQNVAFVNSSGEITAIGAGSCVISATGSISGVTASRTITVNAAVIVERYLQLDKNLSDVANVATARVNLGLGDLATKNSLNAGDVNAVPIANDSIAANTDLDTITMAGQYYQNVSSNATLALHYPETVAGALIVYKTGVDNGCRQEYMPYNSVKVYRRYAFGSPLVFSAWS